MAETVDVEIFIHGFEEKGILLLDARSESEFNQGHIPGAVNLPLLNDEHRKIVGTIHKQKGREAAVLSGFDLVGNKFGDFIRKASELSKEKNVMLYCWRGGMRSGIMSWLLNTAGFKITLLKGGYKSFRSWTLEQFIQHKNIVVIGGRTGSGKTELLNELKAKGEQVIDLEALAHHKGSAFGALGEMPQPRNEHFENLLAMEWSKVDENKILWLENESSTIGAVKIPNVIYERMRQARVVELNTDIQIRKERILNEYGNFPAELLAECTLKLKKRLGDLRTNEAIHSLHANNRNAWLDEVLFYYDKSYDYGMSQRSQENTWPVEYSKAGTISEIAKKVLSLSMIQTKQLT